MMNYSAAYAQDDALSAARGIFIGSILSLLLWAMILTATAQLG
jgi:hypothetical protein